MIKLVQTEYSVRDGGHYSPAVVHQGTVYVAGQLSINPETGTLAEGIKAQTRQALANLRLVLEAAGSDLNHVLICRVYIPDVALWPEVNEVYAEVFGSHKPARIVVPSNKLYGGCLVEVEATAALREA